MTRLTRIAPKLAVVILAAHLQGLPAAAQGANAEPNLVQVSSKILPAHNGVKIHAKRKHFAAPRTRHVQSTKQFHGKVAKRSKRHRVKRSNYSASYFFWRKRN